MNLNQIDIKNFILALFKRDDGERILLGAGAYDFKDSLQHFQANIIANDIIEKQGTDGQLLAGQVRRCQTQTFEGYIGDASTSRIDTEDYRRKFIQFFRTNHFYTVIYIMPNGDAIQRKNGYLVEAPSAPEQYQRFPEYSVGFQFEDLNYYTYSEDDQGEETYAQTVDILPEGNLTGGLVWDGDGVVWSEQGKHIAELKGDTYQETTTGKNLLEIQPIGTAQGVATTLNVDGTITMKGQCTSTFVNISSRSTAIAFPAGTYTLSITEAHSQFGVVLRTYTQESGGSYTDRTIAKNASKVTFTTADDIKSGYVWCSGVSSGVDIDAAFGIQLESGSTATSFESYTGGIPGPNPDYPLPVQIATGAQMVKITGKNLYDKDSGNLLVAYIDSSHPAITASGQNSMVWIPCEPNTTYNIDRQVTSGGTKQVAWTEQNPADGVQTYGRVDWATNKTNINITTGTTARYIVVRLWQVNQDTSYTVEQLMAKLQITKASAPTAYEPYTATDYPLDLGTIELAKLSDGDGNTYFDQIRKDGSDWKIDTAIAKYTVTSDTAWVTSSWNQHKRVYLATADLAGWGVAPDNNNTIAAVKTAKYAPVSVEDIINNVKNGIGISHTDYLSIRDNSKASAADLVTSLIGEKLYYAFSTQTTTTITDANLIAQLEAIDEALEAGGTTTVTPAAGNRAAIITTQPSGNGGAVWDASGGHSTNTITVGGLFAVQPVWIIDGPAESPVMENITDGTSLSYIGNIPAGQTLVIDCTNQTAYLDGANVKNNVRGTWQSFSPGEVTIRYSGANVTQASTLKWNEVVG